MVFALVQRLQFVDELCVDGVEVCTHDLLVQRVRRAEGEMNSSKQREWAGAVMECHRKLLCISEADDAARLGDATAPRGIDHDDVGCLLINDRGIFETSDEVLTGKQRDGGALFQLTQRSRVVGQDEIFDPCGSNGLKGVRDQVAQWLGVDDKRSDVVKYVYAQERGQWAVRIQVVE